MTRFTKINILSLNGVFNLGLVGFLIFMSIISINKMDQLPVLFLIFIIIIDLLVVLLIIWGLTSTITISENEINYKSIFKNISLKWSQIKSYGIYVTGSNVKYILDKKDYNKFIWGGQKNIFVTDDGSFFPEIFKNRPKKGFIYFDFHYREEAIQMIENKMNNIK